MVFLRHHHPYRNAASSHSQPGSLCDWQNLGWVFLYHLSFVQHFCSKFDEKSKVLAVAYSYGCHWSLLAASYFWNWPTGLGYLQWWLARRFKVSGWLVGTEPRVLPFKMGENHGIGRKTCKWWEILHTRFLPNQQINNLKVSMPLTFKLLSLW